MSYATKKSEFNVAVRHTIEYVLSGTYPNYTIQWPLLQLSKGSVPMLNGATATVTGTNLVFDWEGTDSPAHPEYSDRVVMVVYEPTTKSCLFDATSTIKGIGTGTLSMAGYVGKQIHVYMAFLTG